MTSFHPRMILFIIICICSVKWNEAKFNQKYAETGRRYPYEEEEINKYEPKSKVQRAAGLSAWGFIILIISLILLSVGAYYAAIFYPLLCKKERKYDRIELATV